ncbi:terminase small subunit [Bordetella avium]|uniref:terminase small subunit n=1 Tax=Bordetella avium TaxID=521 RepID=UPI000AA05CB7|nr:terminase small subunit [Bordetella avium]
MPRKKVTDRVLRFVDEYLVDLNGAKAAVRAGYSERSAKQIACAMLGKPEVVEAIAAAKARRRERVEVDQDAILRSLLAADQADPNDLSEHRRVCCRYCHGVGHRYQRTAGEMERDREAWEAARSKLKRGQRLPPFDEKGGIGYDKRRDPHDDCPECFGEGLGEVFLKDTRRLSPEARALYAGARRTKDGIEVKAHDQIAVRTLLMRHAGMLQDRVDHTTKGEKLPSSATPAVINVTVGGKI